MIESKIKYSKKGHRKIDPFFGNELLYDFLNGNLDQDRAASIKEYLSLSEEAKSELSRIQAAIEYVDSLSKIEISDAIIDEIKQPSSYMDLLLRKTKFEDWPDGLKMGLEVLVAAIGVISIVLVLPWHRLMEIDFTQKRDVVLLEVEKSKERSSLEIAANESDAATTFPDDPVKMDESGKSTSQNSNEDKNPKTKTNIAAAPLAQPAPNVAPVVPSRPEKPLEPVKVTPSAAIAKPEVKSKTPPPQPPTLAKNESSKPIENDADGVAGAGPDEQVGKATTASSQQNDKRQGFLYRGEVDVSNVTATTAKFIDQINDIGGRKAGQVPLGWRKGTSSYFHFTMPDAKYQNFLDFVKQYGVIKIQREKHDRIMPEGIIRVIITVNEKKQ